MPQLNLTWWLFNFFLGWLSLLILFTILINTPLISPNSSIKNPPTNITAINNWLWT
uniref:ATP synthase complex subunit 8 n=1 Tax=Styracaster yapensis TaxID=2038754 RepID=A0A411PPN2_9ECHI|nr:ATP synthase F0 subunit 8 [Styracaster yapensis]QBG38262.1 ATP synthase F0 subunit 8 [Styracaster yapensis]